MQKNILILWLGAFGFAISKHLGENNPHQIFHANEINSEIYDAISETQKHPYFFQDIQNNILPENVELVSDISQLLPKIDIIISIIPCQFVWGAFANMKDALKDEVIILNLSKGVDNTSLQTVSEQLSEVLTLKNYSYAYLAGGMIASELVEWKHLGADIVTENQKTWEELQELFQSNALDINLKITAVKNTELYAAFKNIIALILGYYEWQWNSASSLGYYFSKMLGEMQGVIRLLNSYSASESPPFTKKEKETKNVSSFFWAQKKEFKIENEINFTDYALSGDLIATCFGWSRNRLLGNMLGEWKSIEEALWELKSQNKIAEWYETLKWIYTITQEKEWFEEINSFWEKFLIK